MTNSEKRKKQTETLVLGSIMTALVIVLQWVGTATTFFGPFSTAVALVPIVIGAAMCGTAIGAWLGFVFGVVVIITGGAALFLAFDVPGTFITVLLKGTSCGLAAGLVYKLFEKYNRYIGVIAAAIVCPVVNTGVFLLGCFVFFMDSADAIASQLGMNVSGMALFWALAMGNFLLEVVTSLVLSPVIVRILKIKRKA
ncbi:MAG: ECF transporter S component [Clostridia bacterium]|nr:ECF transporter S component [Clostridia bacterium]